MLVARGRGMFVRGVPRVSQVAGARERVSRRERDGGEFRNVCVPVRGSDMGGAWSGAMRDVGRSERGGGVRRGEGYFRRRAKARRRVSSRARRRWDLRRGVVR